MLLLSESDGVTFALVQLALDAATLRHQATANNLANIHSTGYRPQRVNFEEQLSALREALPRVGFWSDMGLPPGVRRAPV